MKNMKKAAAPDSGQIHFLPFLLCSSLAVFYSLCRMILNGGLLR
jgi:hypothetical protein